MFDRNNNNTFSLYRNNNNTVVQESVSLDYIVCDYNNTVLVIHIFVNLAAICYTEQFMQSINKVNVKVSYRNASLPWKHFEMATLTTAECLIRSCASAMLLSVTANTMATGTTCQQK